MAGQKRATELRELAELVADTLTNFDAAKYAADPEHYYRPTILSGAVAAAYDAAMARARCPVRAWRGSRCAVEFNSLGHVCQRAKGHSGPHYADEVRVQAVRS